MEDEQHCKESAMGALALFVATFIGSSTFIWYDSKNKVAYQELSTHDTPHDLLPSGMSQYNIRTDSELELMGVDQPPPYDDQLNLPAFS